MTTEFTQQPEEALGPAKLLLYIACVLLGVGAAYALAPTIFRSTPSDVTRIEVLLDALSSQDVAPEYIVFGNSVARDGIDTHVVSAALPGEPVGFNFGSGGQSLAESSLFYQELPDSVETVIQLVHPDNMATADMVNQQKFNAFFMYGFRAEEATKERLRAIHGARADILDASAFQHTFHSRWALRQILDSSLRRVLRTDMELDREVYELYFPNALETPMSPDRIGTYLEGVYGNQKLPFVAQPRQVAQLRALVAAARDGGRNIFLFAPPLNPLYLPYRSDGYKEDARAFLSTFAAEEGVELIDLTDALPARQFVDALHPSAEGAREVSRMLGEQLRDMLDERRR
jgi:hypothetical protein